MRSTKNVLISLFAVFFIVASSIIVSAADIWKGDSTLNWYDASATTLVIDSADDLAAFADAVKSGKSFKGKTVELACDIVWAQGDYTKWDENNSPDKKWTPIGISTRAFNGTFDGKGHTVSGLYYSKAGSNVGFFGATSGAVVKDLHIENSYFRADMVIGSIIGYASGGVTVSGCSSNAYIVSTNATPQNHHVGGIIGNADCGSSPVLIERCAFYGDITSDNGCNVAGIVGQITGSPSTITGCLARGTYTGYNRVAGIFGRGYKDLTVSDCYSFCNIYVWGSENVGGIAGGYRNGGTLTILDCYYDGNFYDSTSSVLGGMKALPTRLGCTEFNTSGPLATFATNSTYYTDSKNDNSYSQQGNQSGIPNFIQNSGDLAQFLMKTKNFKRNVYGEVYISSVSRVHDCNEYYGEWQDDLIGGQKRTCTCGNCQNTEKRDESIKIEGAAVCCDDMTGIRILSDIKKNSFFRRFFHDGQYKSGSDFAFGTVIAPSDLLEGELTVDTKGSASVISDKIFAEDLNSLKFTSEFTLTRDLITAYHTELAVRSFVKYTSDSETVYVYSDTHSFSASDIIDAAYQDTSLSVDQRSKFALPAALSAIKDGFYEEDADNVLIIEDASDTTFAELAKALELGGYTKHSNYEYAGNHFGVYYNDDYVVNFYYTPKSVGKYTEPDQEWYAYGNATTEDMNAIQNQFGVKIEDTYNVMRVIVEERDRVELPALQSENVYTALPGMKTTIAQPFPNDNYSHYGMGYVIQLIDGSYIIIDGGENENDPREPSADTDADVLYKYLVANKPANHDKPVIAAWILTHRHNDHVEVLQGFIPKYKNSVVLEQVIFNFYAGVNAVPTETREVNNFAWQYVTSHMPNTKYVIAHTGYKFYIRNSVVTILCSIDDLAPNDLTKVFINNESIVFDIVIDGEQRLMFTGEVFIPGSRALVNMYGDHLKSDVIQLSHHGHYGATRELYTYIWPMSEDYSDENRFVLWPIGNEEQRKNRMSLAENSYIITCLKGDVGSTYMNKIHSMCDLIFKSGAVKDSSGKESAEKVVLSGAIGNWEVIELNKK